MSFQFTKPEANKQAPNSSLPVVAIRRSGNLLDLAMCDGQPLVKPLQDLLIPQLTYTFKQYRVGAARFDPLTGHKGPAVTFSERRLFRYDDAGRLVCGSGFLDRVSRLINGAGYRLNLELCDPPDKAINRSVFEADWDSVLKSFQFRPKQIECLEHIAGNLCGIIDAPTGFGKGIVAAMICRLYPKATIHIVEPGRDLVEKTVQLLLKYTPSVGQVGCGKRDWKRVTVISADSLRLSDGNADLLLGDEVHTLAAPSYAEPLARYRHSRNFGLSASPTGRLDGADAKLESLFGPVIFKLSYQEAKDFGLVVPIRVEWLDYQPTYNPCDSRKTDISRKRWGVWRNRERNLAFAVKARTYSADTQVLIIVETIEHALYLREHLPEFELCYGESGIDPDTETQYRSQGLLGPSEELMTSQKREVLRKAFEKGTIKKVIATGIWSTGVDFCQLQVLMRADGLASPIQDVQVPGRVCRTHGDQKDVGILIDCLDAFDEGFRRRAVRRRKSYSDSGWEQVVSGVVLPG